MAGAAQVRRCGSQGPAPAAYAHFRADFLESAVAEIVKQIPSTAVFRILKTLRHDSRRGEMPKVDIFRIVAADEQVQQSVAIVVEPDGCVRIDPRRQSRLLGDAREAVTMIIVKQFRASPLDQ